MLNKKVRLQQQRQFVSMRYEKKTAEAKLLRVIYIDHRFVTLKCAKISKIITGIQIIRKLLLQYFSTIQLYFCFTDIPKDA